MPTMPLGMDDVAYPDWVCFPCGWAYARATREQLAGHVCTVHTGTCGICKAEGVPVTEPRDFGHLNIPSFYIKPTE